jgi:hypothetical protein
VRGHEPAQIYHPGVNSVHFVDDDHLLSGGGDGTVRWWDLASGMQTDILQVGREVHSAVVEGVEDPIVIAALTRPFLLWDTASGRLDSLPTRAGFRQRLARHPHSDRLAANSDSGVVVRRLNSPPPETAAADTWGICPV